MSQREIVLWRIAELYTELVDPLNGPATVRGDGESLALMPSTWTPTVREYERLVKLMRDDRSEPLVKLPDGSKVSVRSLWWHLEHWHHRAVRVIRHVPVQSVGKKGRKLRVLNSDGSPATQPVIAYLRDPKAELVRAERAIQFVASRWSLPVEPMLPQAVVEGFQVAA